MEFYVLLGISPDASTADIKRAYRRLARRYHPGINPGDRAAEAMFQRVSEAYETLVDPSRRQRYDSAGQRDGDVRQESSSFVFAEFDFSVARRGAQASTFTELFADVLHPMPASSDSRAEPGPDLHASLTIAFADAVSGVQRQVLVTRHVICGSCSGAGYVATVEGTCATCQGVGQIRWARGHMVLSKPCPTCGGAGRQTTQLCAVCAGQGRTVRSEGVNVRVPAGVSDGVQLRLPSMGHAGTNGGRPGDLYVNLHVQPHEIFRRVGDDLVCVLPVAVHEAVLGARVDVPTLDGPVKLRIPPGTQAGTRLRVAGRGAANPQGAFGDLVFEVQLVLPSALDERSRELMRQFGQIHDEDVRAQLMSSARNGESAL
ncbi:MAG TPA: J domain-containing protein [Vicinamibacterales bacterium]|jgi:molecular chaperone DnaJ